MQKFKAVVFDVDGTLTDHNSWYAFTRDIGGSEAEHLAIYEGQTRGHIGFDQAKEKLLSMWQKTGNADRDHITKTYNGWSVRKEALPLVHWLKQNSYKICLITGSVKLYAEIIAKKLGIEDFYANADLYFDNEGGLSGFHYDTDQARVKVEQLEQFCQKYNLKVDECLAIGDGNNDIGLFRTTGNGLLLETADAAPDLVDAAWKTISTLAEVRPLLENQTT